MLRISASMFIFMKCIVNDVCKMLGLLLLNVIYFNSWSIVGLVRRVVLIFCINPPGWRCLVQLGVMNIFHILKNLRISYCLRPKRYVDLLYK